MVVRCIDINRSLRLERGLNFSNYVFLLACSLYFQKKARARFASRDPVIYKIFSRRVNLGTGFRTGFALVGGGPVLL